MSTSPHPAATPPAWLPHPTSPLLLIDPGDLPRLPREGWRGARLWDDQHLAADVPCGPVERIGAIASLILPDSIVCDLTAAWVHTGAGSPDPVHLALPRPRRRRFGPVRTHQHRYDPAQIQGIAGHRVTTALQTACDLARTLIPANPTDPTQPPADLPALPTPSIAVVALRALLANGLTPAELHDHLAGEHRRRATVTAHRAVDQIALSAVDQIALSAVGPTAPARHRDAPR